jgi:integrase
MSGGSLRLKREPDYWELRVYAGRDPVTQKKRYVSRTFRDGKREANKALNVFVAEVSRETVTTNEATVDTLLATHVDHLEARGRQVRTIDGYRTIARGVASDPIGSMPLAKIKVKDVDDYYVRLRQRELSPATIQRYHALLNAAFGQAMAWEWIARNVVQLATPPSVPRISREIPTPEVVSALLAEAKASRNPENYLVFRLLAVTGARRGEICALRWSNVDLKASSFTIRESIARVASGRLSTKDPKSHQIRTVSVDSQTLELLTEHKRRQAQQSRALGAMTTGNGLVFADLRADPTGLVPIRPDRFTQAWSRIANRVPDARGVRLHDLRHWFASTQLDAGEPLPTVAARIGDNVETLAKIYAHKGRRDDQHAAAELAELINSDRNPKAWRLRQTSDRKWYYCSSRKFLKLGMVSAYGCMVWVEPAERMTCRHKRA